MSVEQNKVVVRRFFEEVYNAGRLEVADELFAPEYGAHHGGTAVSGPERARRAVRHMRAAFPDVRFTVEEMVAEDDRVVVRVTFTGTHRGDFMGVAPTGRTVTGAGVELARLAGGKIVAEGWHFYDHLSLLRQLGALE